jgi:hypothetical protein
MIMNAVVSERRPVRLHWPPTQDIQQTIASIERLAQCWRAGLLTDSEFQAAATDVLGTYLPTEVLLWNYRCDELTVPVD